MTSTPVKKRIAGKKDTTAIPESAGEPTQPADPAALAPKVYVSFFYEKENGDTGFGNVHVSGMIDIRTLAQLEAVLALIMRRSVESGDPYKDATVISWKALDG